MRKQSRSFEAPIGLIFTIDARLTQHSWLDCGMFLQAIAALNG